MKKSWLTVLIGIFGGVSLALVQNKISPIIPALMEEFSITMDTAGFLSTIFAVMGMVIAIPAAFILKKMSIKKAGVLALVCAIIGSLIGYNSSSISMLIVSRIVEGIGVGIISVLTPALISMWFPVEKRGLPMGIWGSWMMISQAILFFASGFLTTSFGWKSMWWIGLSCCILSTVLFILFVEEPPEKENHAPQNNENISIMQGLKNKSSWMIASAAVVFTFCSFTFVSWISVYWSDITGWSMEVVSKWISLLYLLAIGYSFIIGYILNKTTKRKRLLIIAFLIYGIVLSLSFSAQSVWHVVAMVIIFPIFDAMVPAVIWTLAPQTAKEGKYIAVSLGILNIGLNFGILLSAPVSGWIIQNVGWGTMKIIIICICIIAALICSRVKVREV